MATANQANSGSVLRAFEIHTYKGGRWTIDSIFDDRDLAVFETGRMDIAGRYSGVRVVEEVFDEASNSTTSRTVFCGVRVARANDEALKKSVAVRQQAGQAREERQVESAARKQQIKRRAVQKKASPARLIIIMVLLAGFGGGAMFALSHFGKIM